MRQYTELTLSLDLQGKGRVLLRYSGTAPKIRLLIEGRDQSAIDLHADRIAEALQTALVVP
jgi:phosphoglucosamine mutase